MEKKLKIKTRILVIVPYAGLKDVVAEVAKNRDDVEVDIYEGDLDTGVRLLWDLDLDRYDVVMSRGGTATFLKRHIRKPVIDIGVTAFDLIRLSRAVDSFNGKAAIVAFPSVTSQAEALSELLGRNLDVYTINSDEEAGDCLLRLREAGYDLIIGDTVTVWAAKRHGLNNIMMSSGQESVAYAMDRATEAHRNEDILRNMHRVNETLLKSQGQYVYVADDTGSVYCDNIPDKQILEDIQADIQKLQEQDRVMPQVVTMGNNGRWLARYQVIDVEYGKCYVCIVEKSVYEQPGQRDGVAFYHAVLGPYSPYGMLFLDKTVDSKINEQITVYAATDLPVMIVGEKGVGKKAIGYEIYKESPRHTAPMVEIDCAYLTASNFEKLLATDKKSGELNQLKEATLMFINLEALEEGAQKALYHFLKMPPTLRRFRTIFSADKKIYAMAESGKFYKKLLSAAGELVVYVPPLRDWLEDLDSRVGVILYQLSIEYGTNPVSVNAEALQMIRNFTWTENIDQLYRVLRQAALRCKKTYISPADLQDVLEQEAGSAKMSSLYSMEGTLDEITQRIIEAVLKEENMNQSKAAQRLGISRSTLWRKLTQK